MGWELEKLAELADLDGGLTGGRGEVWTMGGSILDGCDIV